MNSNSLLEKLAQAKAFIQNSHLVYTSGKHGSAYINKDAIYPNTELTSTLCLQIAEHFQGQNIEVVAAPVIGGVILSQWIAHQLSSLTGKTVLGVYAEKTTEDPGFEFRRGYDNIVHQKRVLLVEDILNTGGSVKKVVQALARNQANIIGVGALCNRGNIQAGDLGVPSLFSLLNIDLEAWEEKDCPLCHKNVPINIDVGKGKAYLAQKNG